jgi:VCBS repeat protein/flagellar hook capping protein FlgD
VAASDQANICSILLGNGDGTFATGRDIRVTTLSSSVAVGDFDADGHADLVLGQHNGHISVLLGIGDGTFAPEVQYAVGPSGGSISLSVQIGDLNHDHVPDLVCVTGGTAVAVLLGQGHGTFGSATYFETGGAGAVAIEDFDGDGNPDLAAGTSVLLGNGDGTFRPNLEYGTEGGAASTWAGDLNGDGKIDLAVREGGRVTVLLNIGHGPTILGARAFLNGNRALPIGATGPSACVRIEPVGASFDLSDVNLASVRMLSGGTGTVNSISAVATKQVVVADTDHNGLPEVPVCFAASDLAQLFSSVQGRTELEVTVEGRLEGGASFRGPLRLTVIGLPAPSLSASVSPNPMNPGGTLRFETIGAGDVSVRLYDVSGRLVRTMAQSKRFDAGHHELAIDGRDDRGATLVTGVYFYRIETAQEVSEGRVVILK